MNLQGKNIFMRIVSLALTDRQRDTRKQPIYFSSAVGKHQHRSEGKSQVPRESCLHFFLRIRWKLEREARTHFLERLAIESKLSTNLPICQNATSLKAAYAMGHFFVSLCVCVKTNLCSIPCIRKRVSAACLFSSISNSFLLKYFARGVILKKLKKKNKQKGNSENGRFLLLYYITSKIFIALFKLQCGVFTPYTITLSFNLIHSRPHPRGLVFLFQQVVELVLGRLVVLSNHLLPAASCRTIHMRISTRYAPRKFL